MLNPGVNLCSTSIAYLKATQRENSGEQLNTVLEGCVLIVETNEQRQLITLNRDVEVAVT